MNEDLVVTEFYAIYPLYLLTVADQEGRNCLDLVYDEDNEDENPSCPICTVAFEFGEHVAVTRCLHVYHTDCINDLITKKYQNHIASEGTARGIFPSPICPLCRHQLDVEEANNGNREICFRGFLRDEQIEYPRLLPRHRIMNDQGVIGINDMVHVISYGQEYVFLQQPRISRRDILYALQMHQEPVNPPYYSGDRSEQNKYFTRPDVIAYYNRSQPRVVPRAVPVAPRVEEEEEEPLVAPRAPRSPRAGDEPVERPFVALPVAADVHRQVRCFNNRGGDLTVKQAQALCRRNGLLVSGNKPELCQRLTRAGIINDEHNRPITVRHFGDDAQEIVYGVYAAPARGAVPRVVPAAPRVVPAAPRVVPREEPEPVARAAAAGQRQTQIVRPISPNRTCRSQGGHFNVAEAKREWDRRGVFGNKPNTKPLLCKGLAERTALDDDRIKHVASSTGQTIIPTYAQVYNRLPPALKAVNRNLERNQNPAYRIRAYGPYSNGL
jgi:hypothetical protein